MTGKGTKGWDKGADYERMRARLLYRLSKERGVGRCYAAILLLQLRNGCRVSEAVRAFQAWLRTGERELTVPLAKAKNRTRLVVVPQELQLPEECVHLADVPEKLLVKRAKMYAIRKLGVNTHSLRYAYITMLLREGVNPAIVSKIVGHARLDTLLSYVQRAKAEEILREYW